MNKTIKSVLVVDDNAVNRKLALALLKRRGIHAEKAKSGSVALEKLLQGHFDSVLSDICMPEMDGKEVCQFIRAHPQLCKHWVVAYTAHAMETERQSIMEFGFDEFLVKPINSQDLKRVLPD